MCAVLFLTHWSPTVHTNVLHDMYAPVMFERTVRIYRGRNIGELERNTKECDDFCSLGRNKGTKDQSPRRSPMLAVAGGSRYARLTMPRRARYHPGTTCTRNGGLTAIQPDPTWIQLFVDADVVRDSVTRP